LAGIVAKPPDHTTKFTLAYYYSIAVLTTRSPPPSKTYLSLSQDPWFFIAKLLTIYWNFIAILGLAKTLPRKLLQIYLSLLTFYCGIYCPQAQ
jgi:hypothetical protein